MIRNIITASLIVTLTVSSYASEESASDKSNIYRTKKDYCVRKNKTYLMQKNTINRERDNNRHHKSRHRKKLTQTNQPNQPDQGNPCPETMTTSEFATLLNNMLLGKPNTNN